MTDKYRREEVAADPLADGLPQFTERDRDIPDGETMVGPEEKMWLWGMVGV